MESGNNAATITDTGIENRIRAVFDRVTESRKGRYCILVWRMYMAFEMGRGQSNRAKTVFYRALQCCPGAKILYLDAVSNFPGELQDIVDLMLEKELRLR